MVINVLIIAFAILAVLLAIGKIPLSYNFRNLSVRWRTTLLTALAFTAVVALLTVMMAFVSGMRKLTEQTGQPGNVLIMADGCTDEVFSNLNVSDLGDLENLAPVLRLRGRPLASRETYLIVNQPAPDANNRSGSHSNANNRSSSRSHNRSGRRFLQIRGVEDPRLTAYVHNINLLPGGRWFSEAGVQSAPPSADGAPPPPPLVEAVLGEGIAHELGRRRSREELAAAKNPDRLDVGDTFDVGDRQWIVVGVLDSAGSTFHSEIWAKRSLAAALFGKNTYTTLVVRTADAEAAEKLKKFLISDYKKAAVTAQVETDYYKSMSETSAQFSYAIGFIAVVMSIGGVFGVMNTMFAAISQRVKDIGVLRLLGYARWHILVSFLLESLGIALVGGLLGCLLGAFTDGWTASSVVTGQGGGKSVVVQLAVSPDIIATSLLLTLLMGLLGGLLPALSAMRLKALEALR